MIITINFCLFQLEESCSDILKGLVCVTSRKLASQQAELYEMAKELGSETRALYDRSCTHFIHQVG